MIKPSEEIIDKVLGGLATVEEAHLVAEWFATDEGQIDLSHRMDLYFLKQNEGIEDIVINHKIPSDKIFSEIQDKVSKKTRKRLVLQVAAVLIPFIFILGTLWQLNSRFGLFNETEYLEVYVPKGERVHMVFQDGTHAYINSDTKLRYPKRFGFFERKIYLDGEAYFIVEKDQNYPFSVQLNDASVLVHGTSFDVKAYSESNIINIALDEGEVSLNPTSKGRYMLKPGENLTYDRHTGECRIFSDTDTGLASLWRQDVLVLKNTPLSDVLKTLNRKYNLEFIVDNPQAYKYSYTLISENTSLDTVLSDLSKISPLVFTQNGNKVIITIK